MRLRKDISSVWIYIPDLDAIYIGACVMAAMQFKIVASFLKDIEQDGRIQQLEDVKLFVDYRTKLFGLLNLTLDGRYCGNCRMVAKIRKISTLWSEWNFADLC